MPFPLTVAPLAVAALLVGAPCVTPVAATAPVATVRHPPPATPPSVGVPSTPGRDGRSGAPRAAGYRPPLDGDVRVLRAFDPPAQPWLPGHRGVDLAAGAGAVVRAPAPGVVTFAGTVVGRGVVTVLHDDGRRSSVEPVRPDVTVGARVSSGDALGTVEGTTHAGHSGPALHWGVREHDRYVDPWRLLPGRGPVVLLPLR